MNHAHLKTAISEAERFLDRARRAVREYIFNEETNRWENDYRTATAAAAKRASMDLTRALADLRRSS